MNAIILYDEFNLAANANAMLKEAAQYADPTGQWSVESWRLDLLTKPLTVDWVLQDADQAHLLVLAVRSQKNLPTWFLHWLELWAVRRQVQDAALAIFNGEDNHTLAASVMPELSRFAARHGLSLIFDDGNPFEDEAAAIKRSLHEREVARPPTLQHIPKSWRMIRQH